MYVGYIDVSDGNTMVNVPRKHIIGVLLVFSKNTLTQTCKALLASFMSSIFNFDLKKWSVCISKQTTGFKGSSMSFQLNSHILAEFTSQFLQSLFLFLTDSLQLWILILQPVELLRRHKDTSEPLQGANNNI